MQIRTGFFDSIDPIGSQAGDERWYVSDDLSKFMGYLVTTGVLNPAYFSSTPDTALQVTVGTNPMTTQINPGGAVIQGRWFLMSAESNGETYPMTHRAATTGDRYDRVVLRLNTDFIIEGRYITPFVIEGVEGTDPQPPALTRDGNTYEISLARVLLRNGLAVISPDDIYDERFDFDVCGVADFAPNPKFAPYMNTLTREWNTMLQSLPQAIFTALVILRDIVLPVTDWIASGNPEGEYQYYQTVESVEAFAEYDADVYTDPKLEGAKLSYPAVYVEDGLFKFCADELPESDIEISMVKLFKEVSG